MIIPPRTRRATACLGLAMLGFVTAAGCGRGLPGRISGRVTLDGQPLTTGLVTFHPTESGAVAYGPIDADGRYEVRTGSTIGLAPGTYAVTVAANAPPTSPPAPADNRAYGEPIMPLITPLTYARRDRTPLRATVEPGDQTFDFELKSE